MAFCPVRMKKCSLKTSSRPHGRHSQQQPDIVIAGQDANTGAQFDQTMDGPQKIETTWTLVETIPANNENGFPADMSEFEIPGSGACFPDPSGSGQGSREGFRIPMQVGKKEMSAFWPTPTALPIQMIQDIDLAFGTVAILGDGPRPAAAPILNLPRQSRGRPVPAPIMGNKRRRFRLDHALFPIHRSLGLPANLPFAGDTRPGSIARRPMATERHDTCQDWPRRQGPKRRDGGPQKSRPMTDEDYHGVAFGFDLAHNLDNALRHARAGIHQALRPLQGQPIVTVAFPIGRRRIEPGVGSQNRFDIVNGQIRGGPKPALRKRVVTLQYKSVIHVLGDQARRLITPQEAGAMNNRMNGPFFLRGHVGQRPRRVDGLRPAFIR